MASIARRRNRDGSASWDATVRIVGYPTTCRSFGTKLEAKLWANRLEAAANGRTLTLARQRTSPFADYRAAALCTFVDVAQNPTRSYALYRWCGSF